MIEFLLAPACYCAVIEITRVFGIFQRTSKVLLMFIAMLLQGCLLNFVDAPSSMIAAGAFFSWLAICIAEFLIFILRKEY